MKRLVDILAKGLKSWPEGVAAITQGIGTGVLRDSSHQQFRPEIYLELASDAGFADYGQPNSAIVSRAEWQAAVDALNAPKVVEWDGVGLPPVGSEVEAGFACEDFSTWHKGMCIAIGEDPEGRDDICIVQFGKKIAAYTAHAGRIRPIRTAAKVAAEEREKAVNLMLDATNIRAGIISDRRAMARQLYDAGYRKEQKTCGS